MFLKCNNIKCRSEIQRICMVTSCSHIFCYQCYPKIKKSQICIACKNPCIESDCTMKEFNKLPCLNGYSPEEIFEVSQKALSFWLYQNDQEYTIQTALKERAEEESFKFKHELKASKANYDVEVETKNQKIERLEDALERERQNGYDLSAILNEKTKQYQKLVNFTEKKKISFSKIDMKELENTTNN